MLSSLGSWPSVAAPGRTSSGALGPLDATSAAMLTQRSAGGGDPPRLCHELGRGAPCLRCGPVCPGFDLHYWRKACRYCGCSAADHGVYQDDTVGTAQARQLLGDGRPPPHPNSRGGYGGGGRYGGAFSEPTQLEWVPPGVTPDLAERYLSHLPPGRVPVRGTSGAVLRQRSLQTQLPPQDLDVSRWQLHAGGPEAQRMQSYVHDVRQNAVGQGIVCEFPPGGTQQGGYMTTNAWGPAGGTPRWRGGGPPTSYSQPLLQGGVPTYFASMVSGQPSQQHQQQQWQQQPQQWQQQQWQPQQQQSQPRIPQQQSQQWQHSPQQQWQQQQEQRRRLSNGGIASGLLPSTAQWGPQEPQPAPQGPPDLFTPSPGQGPFASDSYVAGDESARWPGSSLRRSPSPSPRAPFRSMGGTSGGLCRAPVTVTGDQPFRGIQNVPPAPEGSVRPVSARRSRSVGRPATASPSHGATAVAPGGSAPALVAPPLPTPAWDTNRRWVCHHCRAPMQPGDVAVFAERAGANKCWHPQCFVCATCQELLVDLIYFYKSGQVFCGRHYAERARLSRCPACDELIFSQQYTEAGGQHWHTRHFCCAACCQPLAGQQYVLREERPHCLDCYRTHYGKVCVTCSRAIAPASQRVSLGDQLFWHATAECFHCYTCRAGLLDAPFVCASNKVFCSDACAQAFS